MLFKKTIVSVCLCFCLTFLLVALVKGIRSFIDFYNSRDLNHISLFIRNNEYDWSGPKAGEKINLEYFIDENGESLSQNSKQELILLSVIDPECGAYKAAGDQMRYFRQEIENKGIDYYIVSFSPKISSTELPQYVKLLDLSVNSYSWTSSYENLLPSIKGMVIPTHILVDSKGYVIKSFPGTSSEKLIRDKMSNQLVEEVSEIRNKVIVSSQN